MTQQRATLEKLKAQLSTPKEREQWGVPTNYVPVRRLGRGWRVMQDKQRFDGTAVGEMTG
jgi:hypothetical protein